MWLYPLPAIVALGLWTFVVFSKERGFHFSGLYVLAAGCLFYGLRELIERSAIGKADL